jgi:hypothetical protein
MHLILFADDTNIFMSDRNLDVLISSLNNELKSLQSWLTANKLSLNTEKKLISLYLLVHGKNMMQVYYLIVNYPLVTNLLAK